jgi:hypothetical protein
VLKKGIGGQNRRARPHGSDIIADLNSLTETEVAQKGKRFTVHSAPRPAASPQSAPPVSPCRRPSALPSTTNLPDPA